MSDMFYPLFLYGPALAAWLLHSETATAWAWWLTLIGNLAYFCLRAATGAASAVSRERELGTWEALCATRLTPTEIYLRKLGAVLRPLALPYLCFLTLPLAYGGLGEAVTASWLPLALLTLVYAWFCATLGLYASLTSRDTQSSGRLTYGVLAVLAIAPLLGWFGLMITEREKSFGIFSALCPTLAYMSTYLRYNYLFREASSIWWLSALLYGGLALALTGAGLRRVAEPVRVRGVRPRRMRALAHVEDAVAYRSACSSSRGWDLTRVGVLLAAWGLLSFGFDGERGYLLWALLAVVWVSLHAIARGVGLVAGERERGTLEVLLASPLRPGEILRSKLRVAFGPVAVDTALACLLTCAHGGVGWWAIAQNCAVLVACAAFFGALAVYCSSRCSTTLKAAQRAYFALGFLALVTFWIDVPLNQMIGHKFSALIWLNPLIATVLPVKEANLWGQEWLPVTFCCLYAVAAVWLLRRSAHHLQGA